MIIPFINQDVNFMAEYYEHIPDENLVIVTDNLDFIGRYTTNVYLVTFVDDVGNFLYSEEVLFNNHIQNVPEAPEKEDRYFTSWDFNVSNPITNNITIRARYSMHMYTVRIFGFNNALVSTQLVMHGSDAILPTVTSSSHTFNSWSNDGKNVTANIDIISYWSIKKYTARFYRSDGDTLHDMISDIDYGSTLNTEIISKPVEANAIFTEWEVM